MPVPVLLPELGESVLEATIAKWLVKEGDTVERDQPLVEVTTDKVDAEIPAPEAGVVVGLLVAEGETVPVGTEIATIDADAVATTSAAPAASATAAPAAPSGSAAARPSATPVAERLAADRGVDLGQVQGSGVSGRITRADVENAGSGAPAAQPPPPAPPPPQHIKAPTAAPAPAPHLAGAKERFGYYAIQEGDNVIPMSPLRKIVAEHMVYSKHTSPHVGTVAEVDMGGIYALRGKNKNAFRQAQGFSLTYLPFLVHATVRALREFPILNASVIEDAIVEKRDIHIGIAVETEKGLVVPVVRNADRLSLAGLAAEVEDLSSRARNKKLTADDLQGGTFTVSNPGRQGNLYGFAIINQPQVGILRMGEMVKRPVIRDVDGADAIVVRPMMHVALSYDHRAVDGSPANGFLFRVRQLLEEADFDV
ncbi:MAG: 2-oxo acid dehydrogenase subunit E2 [Deltaproteobacteria bacterium]|nr:2-oxo acid dehydrogenase subunit E2 [Deltaproteobacteria bacterium]MBW2397302.1 2-oxo acid dehydrogenase subunit E2 [Deltaproteobacteria bacterium]